MSDRKNLLATACANPGDDVVRLAFADWCDEYGESDRATFVRRQVEAARLAPWSRRGRKLAQEAEAILHGHEAAWLAELPDLDGVAWGRFERGLVSEVEVASLEAFEHHADLIFSSAPVCRLVSPRCPDVARLARIGHFSHVTHLALPETELSREAASALAASPQTAGLKSLSLENGIVSDAAVRALAGMSLHTLDFSETAGLTAAGFEALVGSPLAGYLNILSLEGAASDVLRVIIQSGKWPALRALYLTRGRIHTEVNHDDLVGWAGLAGLECLCASGGYRFSDNHAAALAHSPLAADLVLLDVSYGLILTDQALEEMLASPHLARMELLGWVTYDVEGYEVSNETYARVEARFGPSLELERFVW